MFNAGIRGKRAKDSTGLITAGEHFNQQSFLVPTVTRFAVTDGSYVDTNDTAANPTGGQTIVLYGSGFATGATILVGSTTIGAVTFLDSGRLAFSSPTLGSGSYTIFVTNANGGTCILVPGLVYSGVPTFTTSAGSLGSVYETTAISTSVVATGDAPITYALSSGSLPTGSTLSSSGTISGTAPADGSSTTYSFTIQATDAENQDSVRSFSLTINTDVVSFSSPANNASYSATENFAISNVTAVATSAAGYGVQFTSTGLPTGLSINTSTGIISGTPTVVASNTSIITATANTTSRTAALYLNWTVNLPGDLFWKYASLLLTANTVPNGNTFNTDLSTINNEIVVVADTKPSEFNPFKEGYYSNYFDGTGDYLTLPSGNASLQPVSSDFTIEAWVYPAAFVANGNPVAAIDVNATYYAAIRFGYESAGAISLSMSTNGTTWSINTASGLGTLTLNTWQHMAVSKSGTSVRVFLNGVQQGSTQTLGSATLMTGTNNWIGYLNAPSAQYVNGYISNWRLTKTALYTSAFTPPTGPLTYVANTAVLTCQSNKLIDNSNNNFTITKNGDTTVSPFSPFGTATTVTVPDANNYSMYFDGTGDYLQTPSSTFSLGTVFTVEAWVYPTTSSTNAIVFSSTTSGELSLGYYSNSGFGVAASGVSWLLYSGTMPVVNAWNHIAVVRAGLSTNQTSIYINGTRVVNGTISNAFTASGTWRVGYDGGGGGASWTGYISNLRVVAGTDVYGYTNTTITPPTSPLTAITNTRLLTAQANTVIDNSNNAFTITTAGDVRPTRNGPFANTTTVTLVGNEGSAYFDGTGDYLTLPANASLGMGSGNFTVEFWMYQTALSSYKQILDVLDGNSAGRLILWVDSGGTLSNLGSSGGSRHTTAGGAIVVNTWTHVALVRSSGTSKFYINGTQSGSNYTDNTNYTCTTGTVYIGINSDGSTYPYIGYLSNFRMVKGTALYTTPFVPTWAPLTPVANTVLLIAQTNVSSNTKSFVDESNFNNIITPTGNTALGSFTPFGSTWSGYFDGTTDYLTTVASASNQMTGDFTVELWIHPTSVPAQVGLIGINNTVSSGNANFGLGIGSDRKIFFFIAGNSPLYTSTNVVVTVGVWQHVAFVRSGSTNTVYVDGVSVLTNSATPSWSGSPVITVGRLYADNTAVNFYGYISNVRVLKGTAIYTAAFTPPTSPLTSVANTVFLTCNSNRFVDYSPANNAITRTGDTSVSKFSPFSPVSVTPASYSGYFDGTGDFLTFTNTTAQGVNFGTTDFTVELWYYMTNNTTNSTYHTFIRQDTATGAFDFGYRPSATQLVLARNGTGEVTASVTLALNTWNHIAVSRLGTDLRFFVNGSQVGSTVTNSYDFSVTGGTVRIGSSNFDGTHTVYGYISNLRGVRSAVYTTTFTPSATPLTAIANTSLLTCQSTTLIDNSTNNFAITVNGDAKPVIQNPFIDPYAAGTNYSANTFGSSIFFDNYAAASGDYLSVSGIPIATTGQFTFEAWLYTTSVNSADAGMIYSQYTTGDANRWTINLSTANKLVVGHGTAGNLTGAATFPPYQWNHVAVTRDASNTLRIFLNGVVDLTSASYTHSIMQSPPRVGYYNNTPNDYWNGFMSSVRVVNGQALYTVPFIPSNQPLPPTSNTKLLLASTVGPSVTDATRNHNIETFGTARYVANNSPYYDTYSAFFDGTGDYLTITSNATLAVGTADFTIECWVYPQTTTQFTVLYLTSTFQIFVYNGALYWNDGTQTSGGTIVLNTWQHIAVSRSGTALRGFVNGAQVITTTSSVTLTQGTNYIGYNGGTVGQGYISNLRLVKGTALYTATFTPSTTPLTAIANTSLLTCQSNKFIDNSTNALTITKTGDAKITTLQPFTNSNTSRFSSVYFAAKTDYLAIEPDATIVRFPGDFTFECWVYPTLTTTTFWGIWDSRNAGGSATSLAFTLDPLASAVAGSYRMSYYNGTKYYGTTTVLWNQWTHVAWVRSGTTMTFYVNGVAGGTATISGAQIGNVTSTPIYIGSKDNATANYGTNGYIADLRITNGYARTITVPTAPYDIK